MAYSRTLSRKSLPDATTTRVDVYVSEFAVLLGRYPPSREEPLSNWLGRLPAEAFQYFRQGIATFGRNAESEAERRGRLYLIHSAQVLLWITWGKEKARKWFQSKAQRTVKRTATLITLEHYRRVGMITDYESISWFFEPVEQWSTTVLSTAIRTEKIEQDQLRRSFEQQSRVKCSVKTLATLRKSGVIPKRGELLHDGAREV